MNIKNLFKFAPKKRYDIFISAQLNTESNPIYRGFSFRINSKYPINATDALNRCFKDQLKEGWKVRNVRVAEAENN